MSQPTEQEHQLIEGVFSIERSVRIGTGTTARRVKQQAYYFARQIDAEIVEIQGLNPEKVPFGVKEQISIAELMQDYLPEPSLFTEVMGKIREVTKSVARGDKFRKRGETFTAEMEYNKALMIDTENVRANFGIGICYMQRGEEVKAKEIFDRVVKIDAAFEAEHKHLFNEYGIQLRKSEMAEESAEYYQRALELTQDDENLWYNLARAEFDRKKYLQCADALKKCLELAPKHEEAARFMNYLKKKGMVEL